MQLEPEEQKVQREDQALLVQKEKRVMVVDEVKM